MHHLDRQILRIAIPSIVSNITVPLLGLVDLAIVGHLGSTAYIGAISLGGMIFNVVYWIFGFLRMGSSGLTAQAYGRSDFKETSLLLSRSLFLGLSIAVVLLLLQSPLFALSLAVMQPTAEISGLLSTYYHICIWGAPPSLCLFALSGWFLGMQDSRSPMYVAIFQNVTNIAASLLFVYVFGMKVEGVALGTLIAQYTGFMLALLFLLTKYRNAGKQMEWRRLLRRSDMLKFFKVNSDIFFRTCCLVAVFLFFTSAGSWQGEGILATNTILMEFYILFSYIMDGFAFAGEAVGGKFYGAGRPDSFYATVRRIFMFGGWMVVLFTAVYVLAGNNIIRLLTNVPEVIDTASGYAFWTWVMPLAGVAAFVWDGIFIGITASRQMLLSSIIATVMFFSAYYLLFPSLTNHALWLAFILFLLGRGISQTLLFRFSPPKFIR
jgi:MATE family multidrug resistance protein